MSTDKRAGYGWSAVRSDVQAAITVAAISLPQSMADALIAGVDPRFSLYTAIVFTAIASALGSSRHLINGPTGAVSLVVFSALAFISLSALRRSEVRTSGTESRVILSSAGDGA